MAERWWRRIGLPRPELRAWALYDWANSAYVTTIIATVFPIYFASVAAADLPSGTATARFAAASSLSLAAAALLSPVLGALADRAGLQKRLLGVFMAVGVLSTAALALIGRGDWRPALVLFGLGNVGVTGSLVFYDALLRRTASDDELHGASTAGYALGYLGGGLLLALQLLWLQRPGWFGLSGSAAASRLAFLSVAVWWLLFSLPLFLRVPEPRRAGAPGLPVLAATRATVAQLGETFRELRRHRSALRMLLAYLIYSDGIGTIIRMAAIYGTEVGISQGSLVLALLLTQAVGIPCSILFGKLAAWAGAKRALMATLAVYVVVSLLGYAMSRAWHFYVLAFLVGLVQGGSQALSRSVFAQMVPRHKATQFFAFFSIFEKLTAIVGPALFAATIALTGSSRLAALSIAAFFVLGGAVLARVDVEAGRTAAREAERRAGFSV